MFRSYYILLLVLWPVAGAAGSSPVGSPDPGAYYIVADSGAVYKTPAERTPVVLLDFQARVQVLERNERWSKVRTSAGTTGYMRTGDLSNVWIRISKVQRTVYVYRGQSLARRFEADFGYNTKDDKVKQGSREEPDHWRTPEGRFYVTEKKADSRFYKAFTISYPTAEDARRGLRDDLISKGEHAEIIKASMQHERPPMDTALGGGIEIHGEGTGGQVDWTHGSVAIKNSEIDVIWDMVSRGTPVIIE